VRAFAAGRSTLTLTHAARCISRSRRVAARSVEDEAAALMCTGGVDTVHYGQKIRLRLHPGATALAPPPIGPETPGGRVPCLALSSAPVSMAAAARLSKHQQVSWTANDAAYDTVWCAARAAERVCARGRIAPQPLALSSAHV
jgi:hypothetical protein